MQPNPSVPQTENQAYEVPGRQLGWRVNQLQAQGLPYNVQPAGGGVYIVIVQQPTGMDPFAAPAQPSSRRNPRAVPINVKVAAVVVALGIVGFLAYTFAGGQAAIPASVPDSYRNLWGSIINVIGVALLAFLFALVIWLGRGLLPMIRRAK